MKHALLVTLLWASPLCAQEVKPRAPMLPDQAETPRMKTWINYRYGLFIHFSMNTFVGTEQVPDPPPATTYAPKNLDVDSWVKLAKDAGMQYAVLTTKHTAGFCLWDSNAPWQGKEFDYDVAASGNQTDVVRAFVDACKKYGIAPGFYYCLADSYANKSARIPKLFRVRKMPEDAFELAKAQLDELATNYPECHYFWLDTPQTATAAQQAAIYDLLRRKNAANVVLMNHHHANGAATAYQALVENAKQWAYPVDVLNTEGRQRPNGVVCKTQRWQDKTLFIGYEHCDIAGVHWFNTQSPKTVDQLFQLYRTIRTSGGNLLLNVGPARTGTIAPAFRETMLQLRERVEAYENSHAKENF